VDDNPGILHHVIDPLQADYQIIGTVGDGNLVGGGVDRISSF
jgi:hypothetical protein